MGNSNEDPRFRDENSSKFHMEVWGEIQPCQTYKFTTTDIDIHPRKPVIIMELDKLNGYME